MSINVYTTEEASEQEEEEQTGEKEDKCEDALSLSDVLTPDEQRKDIGDVGKRVIDRAPIDCPRCGGKLDPSPYASWTCWSCRNHVIVQGGEGR